jgi:subtilisin family serine protease
MGPVTQAETASTSKLSPQTVEDIEQFYENMAQPGFVAAVDPLLVSWEESGVVNPEIVTDSHGAVSALLIASPDVNMDSIRAFVEIDWWVELVAIRVMKISISTPDAIDKLVGIEGVGQIDADLWKFPVTDDLVKELDVSTTTPERGVDMNVIKDVVGATGTVASGYDGTGVLVGHIDTGADFGNPELQDAYSIDSYDGTGEGLTPMWYYGNSTAVNATAWLADGNLLTYVDSGAVYLNVSGWDPLLNMYGSLRYLYGDGSPGVGYVGGPGFIWLYAWAWGIDINETWVESIKQDWKLPALANLATGEPYQVNWIFQQMATPYAKIFAPAVVYNGTDNNFHLVINWEDTDAWNNLWTGGFYYETLDLADNSTDLDMIYDLFDWDFTDDFADGEIYDLTNPIVAHDYTGDMIDDFSLGALSWCYDAFEFGSDVLFHGFSDAGDFCLYWDDGSHGTATALHVAGQGLYNWWNADNESYFKMEGIAPGADIVSVRALSGASDYGSYLWVCGFTMNETSGEFYYTGAHETDVVTNSWGWITEPASQMDYLAFTWEILSTPAILDPAYAGVFHVFSAGNEGPGYMTTGPPGAATGVLTVGASTSSHWLDYLYGPDQPIEGIASFSSKGPGFTGYSKPDVLAPGLAGYSGVPWYYMYYDSVWDLGADNYTLFSGTSQSAPVTAGVAALVIEALGGISSPQEVKLIMESTAVDLGYEPATQGFGRIDAEAACDFAENGVGMIGGTMDSAAYFADVVGDAWAYWGILPASIVGTTVNETAVAFPDDNWDGGIYFGAGMQGVRHDVHYYIFDNPANMYGTAMSFSGMTATVYEYIEGDTYTFTDTTFSYYDTVMAGDQMYGWFNIRDGIGAANYDAAVAAYNYVTIAVSFDASDVAGDEPWMFLYDWTDNDPHDGMPNLWNATSGEGNELTRLTSAAAASNTNMMPYAGFAALQGNMTLVIHDPVHDALWNATGNDFTCTVIFWDTYTPDTGVLNVIDSGTGDWTANVTFQFPADNGIHMGFIEFDDGGGQVINVPYTYNVIANLSVAEGQLNTVVDGWGTDLEPYDSAMYGCMGEDPDTWDFRSYILNVPYGTAEYLGIRAEWEEAGNDMYIAVYDSTNMLLAAGSGLTDTSTAVIAEIDGAGLYYLLIHPLAVNGTTSLPVNYTIQAMWYEDLTDQPVVLSYTSDDRAGVTPVEDEDTLWGDHVVLNASFPAFNLPNMPEFEVTGVTMAFLSGVYSQHTGALVIPSAAYDPFSGNIDTSQFAWDYIGGISEGDNVDIEVDFTNGDCDIMVWWADTDNSSWSYGNNLVADAMATGAHPEVGSFTADRDGMIAVGIFDYDLGAGTWTVTVDTRVGVYESATGNEVTYDTYQFNRNGTFQVQLSAVTETNIDFTVELTALTFENFFSPEFTSVAVTGAAAVKTITWALDDLNAGDTHTYEVLLSSDDGATYQLIATGLTALSYNWDSTGFAAGDYKALIRAEDSYGLTAEIESSSFTAGTVTETTTTGTGTGTGTGTEDPMMIFWIGLLGGIGVGVVVILILFLIRRK